MTKYFSHLEIRRNTVLSQQSGGILKIALIILMMLPSLPTVCVGEDFEIQEIFNDITKYTKTNKKYRNFNIFKKKVINLRSKLYKVPVDSQV